MKAFARSCMHHVLMKCLLYARHVSGEMVVSDTKKIFAFMDLPGRGDRQEAKSENHTRSDEVKMDRE